MIKKLYIYISHTTDVYENLATETLLLEKVSKDNLILFLWQNANTVVIGQNQNPIAECKTELLKSDSVKIARRLSGGGAVFHDLGNLNFTFLCSAENYDIKKQSEVIKTACAFAGITAEINGRNDILVDGKKFSGNAFYNTKGRCFHHGTILISADINKMNKYLTPPKAKLEAKGVKSVSSRVINLTEASPELTCEKMKEYMILATEEIYSLIAETIPELDKNKQNSLALKYSDWKYIYATPIPCTLRLEKHFSWGSIELGFSVKNGVLQNVQVFTDSLDHNLPNKINSSLSNKPFDRKAIEASLNKNLEKEVADDIFNLINNEIS